MHLLIYTTEVVAEIFALSNIPSDFTLMKPHEELSQWRLKLLGRLF